MVISSNSVSDLASEAPLVLLIDDYEDNRLMTTVVLEGIGCKVLEAPDAFTALSLAKSMGERLSLVITDLSLPGVDGMFFLQQLKQQLNSLPIIVLTALSDPQLKEQVLKIGCSEYLTKPFLPETLQSLVLRYLNP